MSKLYIFPPPKLVTTGLAERFTKTVKVAIDLKGETISNFFGNWKLLTPQEAHRLHYGKVYRIGDPGPDRMLLRVRGRGGDAYHFIDCRYELDTLVADIKTPNAAARVYILLPVAVVLILGVISWPSSTNELFGIVAFCMLAGLVGTFFLNESAKSVRDDFVTQLEKESRKE